MQFSHVKTLLLTVSMAFGLVEASSASTCSNGTSDLAGNILTAGDVTLGNMNADSCGSGDPLGLNPTSLANTPVNDPQLPDDYMGWDVNVNGNGGSSDWQFYYKQDLGSELAPGGTATPDISFGADPINLQITSTGGNDAWSSGTFSVNAFDPLLIVLGDGADFEYTWYLFTGKAGPQDGTWDTSNVFPGLDGGKDLSNITAYTTSASGLEPPSAIPVPAAVWLFGSGLLGLVGVARRKKAA